MLGRVGLRHQIIDLASDNLACAIAEHSFSGGIEQDDAAAPVDGNDRILSSFDKPLEPGSVATNFCQVATVLDNLRKHVRHRLQEMNVVLRKRSRLCGMRSKDPVRMLAGADNHTHPTYDYMNTQQRRSGKSLFRPKIFNDHRLLAKQRIAGL